MADGNQLTQRSRVTLGLARLRHRLGGADKFTTSADYWENRYRSGGNSGAGSYHRLAEFKAEVLNDFVARNAVRDVIEFGVGDGAQLALAQYPRYTGVDIATTVVRATGAKFADDPTITILHTSEVDAQQAELALSLDVIYHLVEDATFDEYMHTLFASSTRYVIVYASNSDVAWPNPHVRHREFTRWVAQHQPEFSLVETIQNRYPYSDRDPENTSFANFYVFAKTGPISSAG